jgi:hypothetical protein
MRVKHRASRHVGRLTKYNTPMGKYVGRAEPCVHAQSPARRQPSERGDCSMLMLTGYILLGIILSVTTAIDGQYIPALCIALSSFTAPVGAGGVRSALPPKDLTNYVTIGFGIVLIGISIWLGTFFELNLIGVSINGYGWAAIGSIFGLLFANKK